jgi:hypothetical protein
MKKVDWKTLLTGAVLMMLTPRTVLAQEMDKRIIAAAKKSYVFNT